MELWKDIPGYEGRYQVSDLGRVRSLDCRVPLLNRHTNVWITRAVKGRVLKPGAGETGHVTVALGKGNTHSVHTLVLLAFEGPPPAGHEVLHRNHTPSDNRWTNLFYGTRSENLKMDYAAGMRKTHPNFNRWGYRFD